MMGSILVVAILAVIVFFAVRSTYQKATRGGGCCPEREADEKRVKVRDRNRSHYPYAVTMKIDGMACSNCAHKVENALNSMEGIWADEVSFAEGKVHVLSKNHPDLSEIRQQVVAAGYTVLRVTRDEK